jgi:hypothetical protein
MPTNKQQIFQVLASDPANLNGFYALNFVYNAVSDSFDVYVNDQATSDHVSAASAVPASGTPMTGSGGSGLNPFSDAAALVKNAADPTKLAVFSAASISPATTRTYTLPDANDTLAVLGLAQILSNKTLASPTITGAITFPDGVRQTFNPDAVTPGLNVGSQAGDPSTPLNGDVWYDATGNLLRARINGATVTLGAALPAGLNTQLQFNNAGVFGGISGLTSDGTNVTAGSGNLRATSPRITTGLLDANGNEIISFTAVGSAINEITVSNNSVGLNPIISATGNDTNIGIDLIPKGTGSVRVFGQAATAIGLEVVVPTTSSVYGFKVSHTGFASDFFGVDLTANNVPPLLLAITAGVVGFVGGGITNGSNANANSFFLVGTNNSTSTQICQIFCNAGGTGNTTLGNIPLSGGLQTGAAMTGGMVIGTNAASPIIFYTGGAALTNERARLTATGLQVKLGITTGIGAGAGTMTNIGVADIQTSAAGVGNGADTTDDTLFTYSLPLNSMSANGKSVRVVASGHFATNANTKEVKIFFAGTAVADSGALTLSNTDWVCSIEVTRIDATHVSCVGIFTGSNAASVVLVTPNLAVSSLATNASIIKTTGASTIVGAANDVLGYMQKTWFEN